MRIANRDQRSHDEDGMDRQPFYSAHRYSANRVIFAGPNLRAGARELARLEILNEQVVEIESLGEKLGVRRCRVCSQPKPLTKEHAPPRATGNDGRTYVYSFRSERDEETGQDFKSWISADGSTHKTLCEDCNHDTGRDYVADYVIFNEACRPLASKLTMGLWHTVECRCRIARVAREALVLLVASSQPGLTDKYPALRDLILKPDARELPVGLRLGVNIVATPGIMEFCGAHAWLNQASKTSGVATIAFAGVLHWALSLSGDLSPGVADVSEWLKYSIDEVVDVKRQIPCRGLTLPPIHRPKNKAVKR